jgi:hypothetical protein
VEDDQQEQLAPRRPHLEWQKNEVPNRDEAA